MAHPVSQNLSTCLCKGVKEGGIFGRPLINNLKHFIWHILFPGILSTCLCKGVEEGGIFGRPVVGVVDEPEVLHHRAVQKSWIVLEKKRIKILRY
jgi:hypothetical protein